MKNDVNLALITTYMEKNALTETEFCKKCNISPTEFNLIYKGSLEIDLITLFKIARLLKIQIHELFINNGAKL